MRGLAAIAVAAYHTQVILAQPEYGSNSVGGDIVSRGWMGVNYFFILSGFIILFAHRRDMGVASAAPKYIWRRVSRVYPIYWIFLTLYITASAAGLGYPDFSWSMPNLASSLLLVNLIPEPTLPLKVAWTLVYEIRFYAVFLIFVFSVRLGILVFGIWTLAILWQCLEPGPSPYDAIDVWNAYFLFGMLAGLAVPRLSDRFGWPLLFSGLLIVALLGTQVESRIGEEAERSGIMLGLALAFAMIVCGSVLLEQRHAFVPPRVLSVLGDASYSVYLVHSAVISVLAQILRRAFPEQMPAEFSFVVLLVLSVLTGVAAHFLVEKPVTALLRSFGARVSRRRSGRLTA